MVNSRLCIFCHNFKKHHRIRGITCDKTEGKAEHSRVSRLTACHPADLPLLPSGFLIPSDGPHWLPSLLCMHAREDHHAGDPPPASATAATPQMPTARQLQRLGVPASSSSCLPSNLSNLFPTFNSRYHTLVQAASISHFNHPQLGLPAPRLLHSIPCTVAKI